MDRFIKIKVIPHARKNEIKKIGGDLKVYLTVSPTEGKANKALLELLADYFNLKRSQLRIVKGEKSRDKIIGVSAND